MSQLRVSERCRCVAVRLLPRCAVPSAHAAAEPQARAPGAAGGGAPAFRRKYVRYVGFRATYYGTTATGKKCTVSRFGCEVHLRDPCVPCVSRLPLKFLKRRRDEPAGRE